MELDLSPEQEALRASVRAVLSAECPPSLVREVVEARLAGKETGPDPVWARAAELGWPALTVPEAAGGLGLGPVELAVVAEELGRAIAPGPLAPTLSQLVPAIRVAGSTEQHARFLGPVARGEARGTLAIAEAPGLPDVADVATRAEPAGAGYVLSGIKRFVVEAGASDEVVVVARVAGTRGDDGVGGFVVPAVEVAIEPVASLDPSRELATVLLDGVHVDAARVLGEPGARSAGALRRAVEEATVALALETVGAAQAVFDMTLEHVKQREQFGGPIGSFQAVKHKLADMFVLLERARALGYFAALCIAEDDARHTLATSMAKAAAADAQDRIAKEGIQLHGGIGYTWEHDVHLYVRRLAADTALLGGGEAHRARVASLLGV